ncbi:MAG: hypothetical protein AABO41_17035 [Acidobacteriota bacterium]
MVARASRRLPGFRFEAQSSRLTEALPRMDVAVFVGFAASGPLQTPVAIEDAAQFAAIFGEDAPLLWDKDRGGELRAHLAPAVRSFFSNGGRRCWIVRVAASEARSNFFPIPGLAGARFNAAGTLDQIEPAFARARSEGSWSDSTSVSAALMSKPVEAFKLSRDAVMIDGSLRQAFVVDLNLAAPDDVVRGDLLRLTFGDAGAGEAEFMLMVAIESVAGSSASPPAPNAFRAAGRRAVWLRPGVWSSPPESTTATARVFTRLRQGGPEPDGFESEEIDALIRWPANEDDPVTLDLDMTIAEVPSPGSLVRVDAGNEQFWLAVEDAGVIQSPDLPPRDIVRVTGRGMWLMNSAPGPMPDKPRVCEKLTFELWARESDKAPLRLGDVGFEDGHSRFWGGLPTDEELYRDEGSNFREGQVELTFERERVTLWRNKIDRRFPLAGSPAANAVYFPIGMPIIPDTYLGPVKSEATRLERDGLARFDASLFLDPDLIEAGTSAFSERADFLRYGSITPRRLRGIHAALGFGESTLTDEATIVAVPDAVHRQWQRANDESPPSASESSPPARPEWWHFLDCTANPEIPRTKEPKRGYFLDCDARVIPAPELQASEPDPSGSFTLTWSRPLDGAQFTLEEAARPNFTGAVAVYSGEGDRFAIYGRAQGDYYYRVRAETGRQVSDWSNGVAVSVSPADSYHQSDDYSTDTLLAVHRGLLRMCGARGDLFAVLALPEHYREDEAETYVRLLKSPSAKAISVGTAVSLPLGAGEANDFSYAAVYHPWVISREETNSFRRTPPDGVACGVLAARALDRGAWIAPANEPLHGVIALNRPAARERLLDLQETQINVFQQQPRGFLAMSEDTLSDDDDLRPINVRRLLILLRRLATGLGARYVFEPNDDSFRRLVQRGFEAMLDDLFQRGAFAGGTPQASFQVVTSNSLNTPASVDQGRFIVELRVAPSLPLTFLTIRLIAAGDRGLVVEGR